MAQPPLTSLTRSHERARALELSRRRFLQLVAASTAAGCAPDVPEALMPYAHNPLGSVPGRPTYYATSLLIDGFATGLLARTREGRPVKLEGNPRHPASLGATGIYHQASVLQLYDPDRAHALVHAGTPASWNALRDAMLGEPADQGAGLRFLLRPTSSAGVHTLLEQIKLRYPASRVTFHAPLASQASSAAAQRLFGAALAPKYDLSRAEVLVALDADPLSTPFDQRYARDFAAQRRQLTHAIHPQRTYALEAMPSLLGTMADHRLARASNRVALLGLALAQQVLEPQRLPEELGRSLPARLDDEERAWVRSAASDLRGRARGTTLVIAGPRQPAQLQTLAYAINAALGNLGQTLQFIEQAVADDAGDLSLTDLTGELRAGKVERLIVLDGNPAYDAPADYGFADAMRRAQHSVYCGLYQNETAACSRWFVPMLHPLECWGDGRAYDGTLSFLQPLVRPLREGKSITQLLAATCGEAEANTDDHARVRLAFGRASGEALQPGMSAPELAARRDPQVESRWREALAQGFASDSSFPVRSVSARAEAAAEAAQHILANSVDTRATELNFLPSPTLHDGQFANLSWLLELPEPITKLTWDNALLMSAATARELGLVQADAAAVEHPLLHVTRGPNTLQAPALIVPGHADHSISIWLGYGRRGSERLAAGVGRDAYPLRRSDAPHFAAGLQLRAAEETYPLAITQRETQLHGRPLALSTTLRDFQKHPEMCEELKRPLPSLYPDYTSDTGPQWGMTIDLSACTGCSACMVACQAENNVLVVGKEQVLRGRQMHWIRIDSYASSGHSVHQPMLCQHCERAPCEYVCPVNATVHSPDGLNEMVYNRCVGTRFCSNNCPYKVRRFNWFNWQAEQPANRGMVMLQRNPEVSVRGRGVMEKCTYCVQRIRAAEIDASVEGRPLRPGEVVTACQEACATRAIEFGSLHERDTPLARARADKRSYQALHETGASPRTRYLVRVDNPKPEFGA